MAMEVVDEPVCITLRQQCTETWVQQMTAMKEMFCRYLFASRLPKAEARRRLLAVVVVLSTASTRFLVRNLDTGALAFLASFAYFPCVEAVSNPNPCAR